MELFKYKNYEDYKKNQIEANVRKINNSYVDPNSLHSLLNYLIEDLSINPKLILCHGTRRGLEQQYIIDFLKSLGVCVLEYSPDCDNKSQAADPFGATLDEYKDLILLKYEIVEILVNEGIQDNGLTHKGIRYFIIIKNKNE